MAHRVLVFARRRWLSTGVSQAAGGAATMNAVKHRLSTMQAGHSHTISTSPEAIAALQHRNFALRLVNPWHELALLIPANELHKRVSGIATSVAIVSAVMCSVTAAALIVPSSEPKQDASLQQQKAPPVIPLPTLVADSNPSTAPTTMDEQQQQQQQQQQQPQQQQHPHMAPASVLGLPRASKPDTVAASLLPPQLVPHRPFMYATLLGGSFFINLQGLASSTLLMASINSVPESWAVHFVQRHSMLIAGSAWLMVPGALSLGGAVVLAVDMMDGTPTSSFAAAVFGALTAISCTQGLNLLLSNASMRTSLIKAAAVAAAASVNA